MSRGVSLLLEVDLHADFMGVSIEISGACWIWIFVG